MLTKHQINANDTFKKFALEELGVDYALIQKGETGKIYKPAVLFLSSMPCYEYVETELRMYRQTTRGDCLLSIKDLKKLALAGDVLTISTAVDHADEEPYLAPEIQIKITRAALRTVDYSTAPQSGGMTYKQAEERFSYLHRRMCLSNTIEAQDYWWKQIQALGSEVAV